MQIMAQTIAQTIETFWTHSLPIYAIIPSLNTIAINICTPLKKSDSLNSLFFKQEIFLSDSRNQYIFLLRISLRLPSIWRTIFLIFIISEFRDFNTNAVFGYTKVKHMTGVRRVIFWNQFIFWSTLQEKHWFRDWKLEKQTNNTDVMLGLKLLKDCSLFTIQCLQ